MNADDFIKKFGTIPAEAPDQIDAAMIALGELENDGDGVPLDEVRESIERSGKLNIRIPKSLHARLVEQSRKEGVSLNQFILYKLAQ